MTDTPKRFPYGGGPSRTWVNPKLAAARGIEVADLPGEAPVYVEPAFDEATDDGAPSVPAEPGAEAAERDHLDLDFEAGWFGAENPADRAAPTPDGVSAAEHLAVREFDYLGWVCDCKATAKTGIPARHYQQYDPALREAGAEWPYRIMIAPGRGEIKQAKGETQVDGDEGDAELGEPVECPTWRRTIKTWVRPARDWSKGKHGIKPPAPEPVEAPPPVHPAGPTSPVEALGVADLPRGCTAKGIMLHADRAHRVTGRQTDDGPVVTRFRLSGSFAERSWVAYWTEGKFAEARLDGRPINLAELRAMLKNGTTPTLL